MSLEYCKLLILMRMNPVLKHYVSHRTTRTPPLYEVLCSKDLDPNQIDHISLTKNKNSQTFDSGSFNSIDLTLS